MLAHSQALMLWRGWAPVSRAKRRLERDKLAAMARWQRRRCGRLHQKCVGGRAAGGLGWSMVYVQCSG